jgi:arylsulfatase
MKRAVCTVLLFTFYLMSATSVWAAEPKIVHDAEYYILEAQNGKAWAVEDSKLDEKLAELRKKYGAPPNIIHYMWDDQPVMSFGDPIYQKIRGYDTPQLNKLAE